MSTPYIGSPLKVGDRIRFLRTISLEHARKDQIYAVTEVNFRGTFLDSGYVLYGESAVDQRNEGKSWERLADET